MSKRGVLLAGLLGGFAPSLVAVANELTFSGPGANGYLGASLAYWLGALLNGLLGVIVVFLYREGNLRKAFALGIAAPGLILGAMQAGPIQGTEHSKSQQGAMAAWIVGVAQARVPTRAGALPQRGSGDSLWIRISGLATAGTKPTSLVTTYTSGGTGVHQTSEDAITQRLPAKDTVVAVPSLLGDRSVREVYMTVGAAETERIAATRAVRDTLRVNLEVTDRSFVSSFARAFGVRSVTPVKASLTVVP
jgi:hypothetical protein